MLGRGMFSSESEFFFTRNEILIFFIMVWKIGNTILPKVLEKFRVMFFVYLSGQDELAIKFGDIKKKKKHAPFPRI